LTRARRARKWRAYFWDGGEREDGVDDAREVVMIERQDGEDFRILEDEI